MMIIYKSILLRPLFWQKHVISHTVGFYVYNAGCGGSH